MGIPQSGGSNKNIFSACSYALGIRSNPVYSHLHSDKAYTRTHTFLVKVLQSDDVTAPLEVAADSPLRTTDGLAHT